MKKIDEDLLIDNKEVLNYKAIKEKLSIITPTIDEARLFQLDLVKIPINCKLETKIINSIKNACFVTSRLDSNSNAKTRLAHFKEAFKSRYETATVKFVEALDPEIGIDYETIVMDNSKNMKTSFFDENKIALFKFNKYKDAIQNGRKNIEITNDDLVNFKRILNIPDSFSAMACLYLNKTYNSDHDFLVEFKYAGGPSAGKLLGRFCQSDFELEKRVKEILKEEESLQPTKIFAEISHIPQARMGNVTARPHLRNYEIQFLANSTIDSSRKISIDDLYLRLEGEKLILLSKRNKKEVIPRLTNAHNFSSHNLQIYHFLCDLQTQNLQSTMVWHWGFLHSQDYLPRVTYEGVILSPSLWNFKNNKFDFFKIDKVESNQSDFALLMRQFQIPQLVFLVQGDNELFLDLRYNITLEIIKREWKKGKDIFFKEVLFHESNLVISDENKLHYTNELIVPFTRIENSYKASVPVKIKIKENINRNLPPGSNWVYFKIYSGISTSDKLIREVLNPFVLNVKSMKIVDKWFFIRYADPGYHLRLRFKLNGKKHLGQLINTFSLALSPLIKSNQINDISLHVYKR